MDIRKYGTCVIGPGVVLAAGLCCGTAAGVTLAPGRSEVVVAKDAVPIVRFAGAELTNYLSRVLGAPVPIVAAPSAGGKASVILGENEWSRAAGIDVSGDSCDSFAIRVQGERVFIVGRDDAEYDLRRHLALNWSHAQLYTRPCERATLFGVYDFLEQHAGCRFYFHGELGEIVPKKARIEIPDGERRIAPNFVVREPYCHWKTPWYGESPDGKDRERIYSETWLRQRLSSTSIPCCHGSQWFRFLERFGKTRPDYMALKENGTRWLDPKVFAAYQYCWSNPDLQETLYQDVKAYLTGRKPETRGLKTWGPGCRGKYVDIMPDDSFAGCFCERCQKAYVRKPGDKHYATELMWGLTKRLAQRLIDEGVEGNITMMSYPPYGRIPDFDLPTNVHVMVATTGPWLLAKPEAAAAADKVVRDWAKKVGHRVWVWTYPHKWGATAVPGVPSFAPRAWGRYFHGMQDAIFGSFAESETEDAFYHHLNYYVFSRVGWDRDCDVDAVVDEYHRLMFGAAESEMKELFDTLERKWTLEITGNVEQTPLGPVAAPPSVEQLWTKVFSPEVRSRLAGLLAAARAKVVPGSLEARRIDLMKARFFDGLVMAADRWAEELKTTRSFVYDAACGRPIKLCRIAHLKELKAPTVETLVTVKRTAHAFVVDFDCEEPKMDETLAVKRPDDDFDAWQDNGVEFMLNASDDGKTVYHFMLTTAGTFSDAKWEHHGAGRASDYKWSSGATRSFERTSRGWRAHFEVPLTSLPWIKEKFRANFCRNRVTRDGTEFSMSSKYSTGYHLLEKFGWIVVKP